MVATLLQIKPRCVFQRRILPFQLEYFPASVSIAIILSSCWFSLLSWCLWVYCCFRLDLTVGLISVSKPSEYWDVKHQECFLRALTGGPGQQLFMSVCILDCAQWCNLKAGPEPWLPACSRRCQKCLTVMNLHYERTMTLSWCGGALCQELHRIACFGPRPGESPEGRCTSLTSLWAKQELGTVSLPAAYCLSISPSTASGPVSVISLMLVSFFSIC